MNAPRRIEPARASARLLRRHLDDAAELLARGEWHPAAHLIEHVLDVAQSAPGLERALAADATALLSRACLAGAPRGA